jgi:hypothetical protein
MSDTERQDEHEDVIDGEIVAELDDHTLLNLPMLDGEHERPGGQVGTPASGRRGFMLRVLLGGTAALALGGSAALYLDQRRRREPQLVILPNGSRVASGDAETLIEQIALLNSQLADMTAERDRLLGELAQASNDLNEAGAQLAEALAQLEDQRALNELWQQHDSVGLDDLLIAAFVLLNPALLSVMNFIAILRAGLSRGQGALDAFVAALPGPQQGIAWLKTRVSTLAASLDWVIEQVQEAIEPVEPFAQLIANFVIWVLERLPFGIGAKAEAGLEAMQTVITGLPEMVEGINTAVLDPLADWFAGDEQRSLAGILLNPIVDNVFGPAGDVLQQVTSFDTTYQAQFATPVQQALDQRAAIRQQIQAIQARIGGVA